MASYLSRRWRWQPTHAFALRPDYLDANTTIWSAATGYVAVGGARRLSVSNAPRAWALDRHAWSFNGSNVDNIGLAAYPQRSPPYTAIIAFRRRTQQSDARVFNIPSNNGGLIWALDIGHVEAGIGATVLNSSGAWQSVATSATILPVGDFRVWVFQVNSSRVLTLWVNGASYGGITLSASYAAIGGTQYVGGQYLSSYGVAATFDVAEVGISSRLFSNAEAKELSKDFYGLMFKPAPSPAYFLPLLAPAGGGGTDAALAETAAAADALDAALVTVAALTDAAAGSDSLTAAAQFAVALADAAAAGDALAAAWLTAAALAEAAAPGETLAADAAADAALAEAAGAAADLAASAIAAAALTESAASAEQLAASAIALAAIADTAAGAEALAGELIAGAALAESAGAADALAAEIAGEQSIAEASAAASDVAAQQLSAAALAEAAAAADSLAAVREHQAALAEALAAGDAYAAEVAATAALVESGAASAELAALAIAAVQLAEAALPADAVATAGISVAALAEVATPEAVVAVLARVFGLADRIGAIEVAAAARAAIAVAAAARPSITAERFRLH